MKRFSLLAAGVIALGFASSPALALSPRTFVSGTGSDTGTCALVTPCRTFAYALTQTAPSGEIIVLSSAGYGPVTITQSVSIINTGNFAGVTVASGNGITVNAGANDTVTLRGLTIDGGGTGSNGIVFNSGLTLTVDQCDLMNFVGNSGVGAGYGIIMQPTSGGHNIIIMNTSASNNQSAGVYYFPLSGNAVTAFVIDRVSANNNGGDGIGIDGFLSSGTTTASISNSIATLNQNDGFVFFNVTASIDATNASCNRFDGVFVGSGTLALGRSVLMNNDQYGLHNIGTVNSYKDNRIAGNVVGQVSATPAAATLF